MAHDPLLNRTIAERVADEIQTEIRQGRLGAGSPLRQNDIAERFGVSSTPVREAFQILQRLGLVEREGRRGVRVLKPSVQDLIDGYEVREGLETLAARLAASRVSNAEVKTLNSIMGRMHAVEVSQKQFIALNAEFHTLIATISGNRHLAELVVTEQSATASYIVFLGVDSTSAHEAHEEHAAILDAIVGNDPDRAASAMAAHLIARVEALTSRLGHPSAARGPLVAPSSDYA